MTRKLAVNVTVGSETYEAGTVPPAEVAGEITNPKAWADEVEADEPKPRRRASKSDN